MGRERKRTLQKNQRERSAYCRKCPWVQICVTRIPNTYPYKCEKCGRLWLLYDHLFGPFETAKFLGVVHPHVITYEAANRLHRAVPASIDICWECTVKTGQRRLVYTIAHGPLWCGHCVLTRHKNDTPIMRACTTEELCDDRTNC